MATRPDLARQVTAGLLVYAVLLSLALFAQGLIVNERAERMVWQAMLDTEMDDILERRTHDAAFAWRNNGKLDFHVLDGSPGVPVPLRSLRPGLTDNVFFAGNEWVVLVRDHGGVRHALALDIDGFEAMEHALVMPMVASSAAFVLLLGVAVYVGVRLLVRPLRDIARNIGGLSPDRAGKRVETPARASAEMAIIADALNGYLARNEHFVERERAFINTASHELRTPVAVIRGAAQLGLEVPDLPVQATRQLGRIARITSEMEALVSVLLVLARDPERIRGGAEHVRLDLLLPAIVEDHRHLCADKALGLRIDAMAACEVVAPEAVVRIAVGNLLRNAIENSDRGEIGIRLDADAGIRIQDPGHGMTHEEISALYVRLARGGDRGAGIGLALISRLSEHLGWTLDIQSTPGGGTVASLDLSSARAG